MKAATKYRILESQKTKEPMWDPEVSPHNRGAIIDAFKWYGLNKNDDFAAKYLGVKDTKLVKGFETLAWAKRMQQLGCVFPEKEAQTIIDVGLKFKARQQLDTATATPKKVINIQELVDNKADRYIADLEGFVDEFGIKGDYKGLDVYNWLQKNEVKAAHATRIVEYFRKQAEEPLIAASGKDEELTEAYSSYSKKRLMNLLQCYATIIKDVEKLVENKKIAKKPRKKKPVSFEKRVSKVNYMKQEPKLKLQSIDPVNIIGSQQLWVYNVKTKKLGTYIAESAAGLSIKGSSIEGYAATSVSKTLRKPEKILASVISGGKVALRKVLEGIKSKEIALNGRINKDTILLRVI